MASVVVQAAGEQMKKLIEEIDTPPPDIVHRIAESLTPPRKAEESRSHGSNHSGSRSEGGRK